MQLYRYKPGTGLSIKQYYKVEDAIWRLRTIDNNAEELITMLYDYYEDLKATHNSLFKEIEQAPTIKICRIYDYEPGTGRAEQQFYKYVKAIGHGTINLKCLTKDKIITLILSKYEDNIE